MRAALLALMMTLAACMEASSSRPAAGPEPDAGLGDVTDAAGSDVMGGDPGDLDQAPDGAAMDALGELDAQRRVDAPEGPDVDALFTDGAQEDSAPLCEPCSPSGQEATWTLGKDTLIKDAARTRGNPLKGLITSYAWGSPANDLPDSMEFLYLPMKDLWGASGATLATGLEPRLQEAALRGHHVVLRIYIDYPTKPSGLPDAILEEIGCTPYPEHGGGCSPDYDHPILVEAMLDLIAALGAAYD